MSQGNGLGCSTRYVSWSGGGTWPSSLTGLTGAGSIDRVVRLNPGKFQIVLDAQACNLDVNGPLPGIADNASFSINMTFR
jgi:hypothetical protein